MSKHNGNGRSKISVMTPHLKAPEFDELAGRNFRELLDDTQHLPAPDLMCAAVGVSHGSLHGALNGMGHRMADRKRIDFEDLAHILLWGISLGYSYAKVEKKVVS